MSGDHGSRTDTADEATEGGTVSRDVSSGAASRRITPAARRGRAARPAPSRRSTAGTVSPGSGEGLVVGPVPASARLAGGLLLLAAVLGIAALFTVTGFGSALVALLVPAAHGAVGAGLVRGAVPKFGLAYAGIAGALAVGQLLIELYRGSSSTTRPGVEVIAGVRVLTSSVAVGTGWVLGVAALAAVVAAGVCAIVAWGRTVMEDGGALDPVRSGLAGAAVLLGVGTVLVLALPAADVPDQLVTDPSTGLVTVVTREGPQALLERPGLALLGGLLLAGAVVLCSVIAPSLRPRLATVGGLLAITVAVLAAALTGLRDAVASPDLEWTVPGAALLLAGVGYAVLTVLAWRLRRTRA
jgi:hypothetical protein